MKKSLLLFAAFAIALMTGCSRIETGNVGVEHTLGQYKEKTLDPGLYETMTKTVYEVSGREVHLALDDLKPKSSEQLTISDFDIDIYYQIDPGKASSIMTRFKGDVTDSPDKSDDAILVGHKYFTREARRVIYNVASSYKAGEMNQKREEIEPKVREQLQAELDKEVGKNWFNVRNVNVRNIVPDPAMEESIRKAAQTANEINRKEQEKQLAIKEAERKVEEAKGIARANEIIAASLTPTLVRLKEIEAQQAFAKQGTHTVLMNGGSGALINVGK